MESIHFIVRGNGLFKLPGLLMQELQDPKLSEFGKVKIVYSEKLFCRTWTTLMATTVFDMESDEKCLVTITSGGGHYGLLRVTWGSHAAYNRELREMISNICRDRSWTMIIN